MKLLVIFALSTFALTAGGAEKELANEENVKYEKELFSISVLSTTLIRFILANWISLRRPRFQQI